MTCTWPPKKHMNNLLHRSQSFLVSLSPQPNNHPCSSASLRKNSFLHFTAGVSRVGANVWEGKPSNGFPANWIQKNKADPHEGHKIVFLVSSRKKVGVVDLLKGKGGRSHDGKTHNKSFSEKNPLVCSLAQAEWDNWKQCRNTILNLLFSFPFPYDFYTGSL